MGLTSRQSEGRAWWLARGRHPRRHQDRQPHLCQPPSSGSSRTTTQASRDRADAGRSTTTLITPAANGCMTTPSKKTRPAARGCRFDFKYQHLINDAWNQYLWEQAADLVADRIGRDGSEEDIALAVDNLLAPSTTRPLPRRQLHARGRVRSAAAGDHRNTRQPLRRDHPGHDTGEAAQGRDQTPGAATSPAAVPPLTPPADSAGSES